MRLPVDAQPRRHRSRQIAARCDLPEPAGPASTTTGDGQSGQRSISATAWRLASETTSSSREWPVRWPRSSGSCRGLSDLCASPCISLSRRAGLRRLASSSTIGESSAMALVERRFQIAGDGEAHQHGDGGRGRHGDQQADEAEQRAEGEQREHQPDRMQADALADQPRLQDVALDELADEEHAGDRARPSIQSGQNCTKATPTDSTSPTSEPT